MEQHGRGHGLQSGRASLSCAPRHPFHTGLFLSFLRNGWSRACGEGESSLAGTRGADRGVLPGAGNHAAHEVRRAFCLLRRGPRRRGQARRRYRADLLPAEPSLLCRDSDT